jgi:hypothetical protein
MIRQRVALATPEHNNDFINVPIKLVAPPMQKYKHGLIRIIKLFWLY